MAGGARAAEPAEQKRQDEEAEKNPEQNDGDARERRGEAAKAEHEHGRDQSGNEKADGPTKHGDTSVWWSCCRTHASQTSDRATPATGAGSVTKAVVGDRVSAAHAMR
jgi:hypothetical protein